MILDILSLFGGGFLRLLPEIMSFINKRADNAHELALMEMQEKLQTLKGQQELAHDQLKGDIDGALAMITAQTEALKGQMQRTSIWIVDVLNFLVRPLTTYYFLAMYGAFKIGLIVVAYHSNQDFWMVLTQVYDDQDRQALWGILGFWFVGRTFDKQQAKPVYKGDSSGQF